MRTLKMCGALAVFILVPVVACSSSTQPAENPSGAAEEAGAEEAVCGPQAPRDISREGGTNGVPVPDGEAPNLCNVHFHDPFEHSGWSAIPEASDPSGEPVCKTVDHGSKVEFHWVYTNCELPEEPKKGLANCVCDREDIVLRVVTQAYVVDEEGDEPTQPEGEFVEYAGSTTGNAFDEKICSPAKVNWSVNPKILKLSKESLGEWCNSNPWPHENYPHPSRAPVAREDWLSPFTPPAE